MCPLRSGDYIARSGNGRLCGPLVNGLGHFGLGRQAAKGGIEHGPKGVDQHPGSVLPGTVPDIWRLSAKLDFHGIQRADALQDVGSQGRRDV